MQFLGAALFSIFVVFLQLCVSIYLMPYTWPTMVKLVGNRLRRSSNTRRELLLARTATETKAYEQAHPHSSAENDGWGKIDVASRGSGRVGAKGDSEWDGVVGFFHPFCNAGGGGERVLWAAIRATQKRWPRAICVVYTGDHDAEKDDMLKRVKDRFNIHLHAPTVHFLYLTKRDWVLASKWPRFTLLGQSLGSVVLAWDAFQLLVPDIFIDTMGYAFALSLCSWLFPDVPTGAYVHYPTISTDMLDSLQAGGQGVNAGAGAGLRGVVKTRYWKLFATIYSKIGSSIDVVMTNSTWTQSHIQSLWGLYRGKKDELEYKDVNVVFPPVAVEDVTSAVEVSEASESLRGPHLLYIAQFRPEKNHQLILEAFASFVHSHPKLEAYPQQTPKLVLIGSVRGSHDDAKRVYMLRCEAHELGIKDHVEFITDAPWPQMLEWMGKASVGVNGMWNEHFGIGVVEYQAAGLISVVNNSGGPKLDIVVEVDAKPTGFHATTKDEYAKGFQQALSLSKQETISMRQRARKSSERFTDRGFAEKWLENMEKMVTLQVKRAQKP